MVAIMACQKGHSPSLEHSDAIRVGRFPEGSFDFDLFNRRQSRHVIEAAAANDAYADVIAHARQAPVIRREWKPGAQTPPSCCGRPCAAPNRSGARPKS